MGRGGFESKRLTPLSENTHRKRFYTYDIESSKGWNNYLMGGFYDGGKYIFCDTLEKLVKTCLKGKHSGGIIYAHYGGGYDIRFILDYILKNYPDYGIEIIETHGLIMSLEVYSPNRKKHWRFWDSYQVIKGSLDDLTQTFDVEHKKLGDNLDKGDLHDTPQVREYLNHDVIGLFEVIDDFYKIPLVSGVGHKMTTSSLAMAVFRQKYLKDTILYKVEPDKEEFIRAGYYGGRNEIFKMEGRNVFEYDINSMYVSAMLNPLPCGSAGTWAAGYDFSDEKTVGFIYASVVCPDNLHIPLLPYRHQGKLLFPKGCFDGVFYSAELRKAIELGYKVDIHQALIFPAAPFLADYARDCWEIRQDNPGDNPLNMTAKLLGNGIYGKFAQSREMTGLIRNPDFEEAAEKGWTLVMPEYDLWRYPTFSNSSAILPYISAAITAHSRLTWYEYASIAPKAVLYGDTDSLFMEGVELPTGPGLGELKFENHYKRFIGIQPKFYYSEPQPLKKNKKCRTCDKYMTPKCDTCKILKNKLRAKGFHFEKGVLPWNYKDFRNALDTGDYSVFYQMGDERFSKLREAIKNLDLLMLVQRSRSVQSDYSKRTVNADYTTTPLSVQELEAREQRAEWESYQAAQERLLKREHEKSKRYFRRLVLDLGGIKPSRDYKIPLWCRRKAGQGLDEMVSELNQCGYPVTDADGLFEML